MFKISCDKGGRVFPEAPEKTGVSDGGGTASVDTGRRSEGR